MTMSLSLAANEILKPFRGGDLLLDTNLLLLWVIGKTDVAFIRRFGRTKERFEESDFALLTKCFGLFKRIVSTPNIVTETSHFLDAIKDNPRKIAAYSKLHEIVENVDERYLPSLDVLPHPATTKFGVADAANIIIAESNVLLLSIDAPLVGWARSHRLPAVNYTHLRFC
jgi:hypothetical protein